MPGGVVAAPGAQANHFPRRPGKAQPHPALRQITSPVGRVRRSRTRHSGNSLPPVGRVRRSRTRHSGNSLPSVGRVRRSHIRRSVSSTRARRSRRARVPVCYHLRRMHFNPVGQRRHLLAHLHAERRQAVLHVRRHHRVGDAIHEAVLLQRL